MKKIRRIILMVMLSLSFSNVVMAYTVWPYNPTLEDDKYSIYCQIGEYITEQNARLFVAVYDSSERLISIQSADASSSFINHKIEFPMQENYYAFKIFLWDGDMTPLADVNYLVFNEMEIKKEKLLDGSVNLLFNKTDDISEVRILRPESVNMWNPEIFEYKESEIVSEEIENDYINLKENGRYLLYKKNNNNSERVQWVEVSEIDKPNIELNISFSEDLAIIDISLLSYNENAAIKQLVWFPSQELRGWSPNVNVYEKELAEEFGNNISLDKFQFSISQNGKYTVIAVDEWGNTDMKEFEIQGLEK